VSSRASRRGTARTSSRGVRSSRRWPPVIPSL
jgi:hypothetical protein